MFFPDRLVNKALLLIDDASKRRLRLVLAESCTGGLLAGLLVGVPGSSKVVERGFVTYSNKAKEEVLGIPGDLIADAGAVSEMVARTMAEGALQESRANLAISITGIAGPSGGTRLKPIGTVHMALARENQPIRHEMHQFGDIGRDEVRLATLDAALDLIAENIK